MRSWKHYEHVMETITLVPPKPKTWMAPTYQLERSTVRRQVKTPSPEQFLCNSLLSAARGART